MRVWLPSFWQSLDLLVSLLSAVLMIVMVWVAELWVHMYEMGQNGGAENFTVAAVLHAMTL